MRIPKSSFFLSVVWVGGGTALGQALFVMASPVLSFFYTPQHFGEFASFMALILTLLPLATLRYEVAIPLPEADAQARYLTALCLGLTTIVSIFVGIFLWTLNLFSFLGSVSTFWYLAPVSLWFIGLYQTFNHWAIRRNDYSGIAQTKILQGLGGVLTHIGLGYFGLGTIGLIIGEIVGRSAGLFSLARGAFCFPVRSDLPHISAVAKRYRNLQMLGLPTAIINTLTANLPVVLVASLYSTLEAGWFGLMNRLIAAPVNVLGQAIAQVYFGQAASTFRAGGSVRGMTLQSLKVMLFVVAPLFFIFGALLVPLTLVRFYGDAWHPAAALALPLSLGYLGAIVASPLSPLLNILERPRLLLAWNVARFAATLGIYGGAFLGGVSFVVTVWLLSLLNLVAYSILAAIVLVNALRH